MEKLYDTSSLQLGCAEYNQEFETSIVLTSYRDYEAYLRYIIPKHLEYTTLPVTLGPNHSHLCVKRKTNNIFSIYKYDKTVHIERNVFGGRIVNDIVEDKELKEDTNRLIETQFLNRTV